jgi:hypothetical protein
MRARSFLVSALSFGLLVVSAPNAALARQAPAVSAASLQQQIAAAASGAASQPGFAKLSRQQKLAAIQAAVSTALAKSGATPQQIATALIQAVGSNIISAGVAISIASAVAPEMAQQVATAPVVVAQLQATGQSANVTASTNGGDSVSVLVSLQGAATPGSDATTTTTQTATAPYDPCAGVIATYCGS